MIQLFREKSLEEFSKEKRMVANIRPEIEVLVKTPIGGVFDEYRQTQMAIESLQKRLNELKPVLTEMVRQEEDEFYIRDGYKAQIVTTQPSKALKTKAEVLTVVPKKYHYQILKDKKGSSHLKIAVAPKENTVKVTITE
tara:strand:- start:7907 stop:8323 length:417 start_codon:yes stop_codon:yes gene_type:complete